MEPLKNLFRPEAVLHIAGQLEKVGLFHAKKELKKILKEIEQLELKERVHLIAQTLENVFPHNFIEAIQYIEKCLAPKIERKALGNDIKNYFELKDQGLDGFLLWPLAEYIAHRGIDYPHESLTILKKITILFTSEFAIRPFILKYQEEIYDILKEWALDENEHIRRLTSEGTRPRLPWGIKLSNAVKNPQEGINILELLKYDESLYVRKSVANHLNDISKDHPQKALEIFKRWQKNAPRIHAPKIEWIIKHAGRNLIKNGDPEMLKVIGVKTNTPLKSTIHMSKSSIKIGQKVLVDCLISNPDTKKHKFIFDFKIHYVRPTQKKSSKIFKGKTAFLNPKEKCQFQLNIPFIDSSIRKHFEGIHQLDFLLNGKTVKTFKIHLKK